MFDAIIEKLRKELVELDMLITALQELRDRPAPGVAELRVKRRRGRTSMGAEERRQVGDRIRRYWAERRALRRDQADAAAM